jgi:hypothetical protein
MQFLHTSVHRCCHLPGPTGRHFDLHQARCLASNAGKAARGYTRGGAPIGFTKSNINGYRIIVRRDDPTVRLYSRNAYDWTVRPAGIAAAAELIKAKSFTIDGEAVVLGAEGLSPFGRHVLLRWRQVLFSSL